VIIRRILASRYTELYSVVFVSLAVIVFYGSSMEGQASFLDSWVKGYVEEKALALNIPRRLSSSQMSDINSLFAGSGGDGSAPSPAPSTDATTIGESALLALTPPDDDYISRVSGRRAAVTEYVVQDGDLLSFIASDFGVSQLSIIWASGIKDADSISPGQVLRVPPIDGVIHRAKSGDTAASLAKKYGADESRIIAYNRLPKDGSIDAGDDIVVPDGRISTPTMATSGGTPSVPLLGTASVAKLAKAASLFDHLPNLGDYFKLPASGFDWGRIHGRNGVDIANSCGTPIYAAADGTVTISDAIGYNGGFGKYIKISHPNGTETLYGHASKLLVSVGQVVGRGDKIMLMGTTGRSTGCHLHFEVHGAQNPLAKK
jgi:murein DD-endopeptidase MepM/ murein hydrolase activator NlpD